MALVALDLDGTLLTADGRIPSGHALAVAALRRKGHVPAIITGRPLLTAAWVQAALGLDAPLVCFNGAWVGWPDGRVLAGQALAASAVRLVRAVVDGLDASICAYPDARTWIMDRTCAATAGWEARYACRIRIDPEAIARWSVPTIKLMVVAAPTAIPGLVLRLRGAFAGTAEVVASQDDRLEIMPAGVTKAHGLRALAARYGQAREAVWAVGDADNDVEMVAWAGHGCCMGEATPRMRAAARYRLPAASERGLCALPLLRG